MGFHLRLIAFIDSTGERSGIGWPFTAIAKTVFFLTEATVILGLLA
jgi:hypothetical protein